MKILRNIRNALIALAILITPAYAQDFSNPATARMESDAQRAFNALRYTGSFGGRIDSFIEEFNKIREAEAKIAITDVCLSACTLVLGLVDPKNVCVTPHTLFGFHSAWSRDELGIATFHREGTRLVWHLYPKKIQDMLRSRGWDGDGEEAHPSMLYVRGTELGLRTCG
jgi:hypothetical protein